MPVRSLSSYILRWPDAKTVDRAVRGWASEIVQHHAGVQRIGYFGSYARGDWGVGSDLDLIIVVGDSQHPFTRRAREWDVMGLPVPADLLVYTGQEWNSISRQGGFGHTIKQEVVWVFLQQKPRTADKADSR